MIKRFIIFTILIFVSVNSAEAFSKSKILNERGIKVIPAIVKNNEVFIQPFKGVNEKKHLFLLGIDGNIYELKIKKMQISKYKINWGYGNNEAILLEGINSYLSDGHLVAIGNEVKDHLEWKPINKENKDCNSSSSISKSNDYKIKEKYCYNCPNSNDILFFISEEKKTNKYMPCDNKAFRRVIGITTEDGKTKIISTYYEDCDGQPQDQNNYFPLGPVLGILEVRNKSEKEIWIVMKVHGYEDVGIAYIKYSPEGNINKNQYEYDIIDGL